MNDVCYKYSGYKSSHCASAVLLKELVPLGLLLDGFLQFWTSGLGDLRELWIMADALDLHDTLQALNILLLQWADGSAFLDSLLPGFVDTARNNKPFSD